MTRRFFLACTATAPFLAGKAGWEAAFPNWTPAEVDRMLTDSPWARQLTVPFVHKGLGAAARGVRTEMYPVVRWSSALPIRQALALAEFGKKGLEAPRAVELLNRNPTEYIVEIAGLPTAMFPRAADLEKQLGDTARLIVKGRPPLKPADAFVPEHGSHLVATLRFSRYENLPAEGAIQFTASAGTALIDAPFKLPAMVYRGELAL